MTLLRNQTTSSNVCPRCQEAAQLEPMTHKEWQASEYGLPGSSGRYCEDDCHCILLPSDWAVDLPTIPPADDIKLRGDKGTDIRPVVDIGPNEELLKKLMDLYNQRLGKLPQEIYDMPIESVIPYLQKKLYQEGS